MTPYPIARFMASLFALRSVKSATLLDAGAGLGALSSAFVQRIKSENLESSELSIEAFEIDEQLKVEIEKLFACMAMTDRFAYTVKDADFIEEAVYRILWGQRECYDFAILNPPYKKINSDSRHRSLLRSVGIETVNLYSAFVSLAIRLLKPKGQLVAIIPRSFCNGPYYKSFREQLFRESALRQIHLFEARNKAFKDDDVLQENVIVAIEKGGIQGAVTVTTSTDASFVDLANHTFPFERIKYPNDAESFLHIPTSDEPDFHEASDLFQNSLPQLMVEVSTGPVVDFRVREHTFETPLNNSVPLLYPGHFDGSSLIWPRTDWKKPNSIALNDNTLRWLYPTGFYVLVRRFSSKEEKRRIRACVFDPDQVPGYDLIGFENHFNVFHFRKEGLDRELVYGLATFLNTTAVDKYFRRMNGHTQVNATDLRQLRYPNRSALVRMGEIARDGDPTDQQFADSILKNVVNIDA
jgi:adenine-specific DNA-methyltransferase